MRDSRSFLVRVWGLAEDLAVQHGQPLHAFLLLHHVLTHPPAVLRGASGMGTTAAAATAPTAGATSTSAGLPLYATAFDAEWKCEELVTRLRAAEYLLYADVPAAPPRRAASPESATPPLPPSTHTLSRAAGLEALELAEQVLSPVFASSSLSHAPDAAPSYAQSPSAPPQPQQQQHNGRGVPVKGSAHDGISASAYSLDDVVREVADVSRKASAVAGAPSVSAAVATAATHRGSSAADTQRATDALDGAGVQARGASMYFLNPAAVAALAWPRMPFGLSWPVSDEGPHHAGGNESASNGIRGASATATAALQFGAASETITIAVGLVVRAHVLQATVCHRRHQHKRALQCLAEVRRWLAQNFCNAAARARSVRLLWEDLQLRWQPPRTAVANPNGGASEPPPPTPSPALPQLATLPGFEAVVARLIEEEARACAALVQVEECKVHLAILQSCGSLPPPMPLSAGAAAGGGGAAAAAAASTDAFSPVLHSGVNGVAAAAAPQALDASPPSLPFHGHDLRQHYRRYQESVQELHRASRAYMTVVQWIGEEEGGDDASDEEGRRDAEDDGEKTERATTTMEVREQLRLVRQQLSPFCLCALRAMNHQRHPHRAHAAGFDMRLAAEVLGVLHSLSHVYLLYQSPTNAAAAAVPPRTPSAVELVAALHNGPRSSARSPPHGIEEAEARFVAQYRRDAGYQAFISDAAGRQQATPGVVSTAELADVSATLRDPVRRALEHARLCAFIFAPRDGASAAGLEAREVKRVKTEAPSTHVFRSRPCWRVRGAGYEPVAHGGRGTAAAAAAAAGGAAVHEVLLLWGLMEMGLRDNFTFVLRLQRELGHGLPASTGPPHASRPSGKLEADVPDSCKRSRSQGSTDAAPASSSSELQPPASWSWVLPGVRHVLQLYVELCTALMQVAATTSATNPASSPSAASSQAAGASGGGGVGGAAVVAGTPGSIFPRTAGGVAVPAIPILCSGLQHAERLMARLLFTLDAEMLKLTGNTWGGTAGGSTSPTLAGDPTDGSATEPRYGPSRSAATVSCLLVDQLQCAAPVQLCCLVHIKAAALLTMARCHLTQLSVVRAVHHLREAQQFTRVFHRQAKQTLLPEMHLLLACVATCLSLRQLPAPPGGRPARQPRLAQLHGLVHEVGAPAAVSRDGDGQQLDSSAFEALAAFARGWSAVGDSGTTTSSSSQALEGLAGALGQGIDGVGPTSAGTPHEHAFAISPAEEVTLAHDVGLPYLHLLAAERASCTTLHTPPSLLLLVYLLKAWAVFQLAHGGEELVWTDEGGRSPTSSPLPLPSNHTRYPQQPAALTARRLHRSPPQPAAPRSPLPRTNVNVNLSPPCPPLPSPSHATTTLNSTVEDQQRRAARLESLTTTPTSTPTLRSRHATLPMEMQRIQLEPAVMGVGAAGRGVVKAESKEGSGSGGDDSGAAPDVAGTPAKLEMQDCSTDGVGGSRSGVVKVAVKQEAESDDAYAAAGTASVGANWSSVLSPPVQTPPPSGAHTRPAPPSQRHRASDALHRMLDVLLHHYDAHNTAMAASPSAAVGAVAWTPQNVVLLRLLRGATLLYADRDEPAAARELKEATHYAKQHLGVLHPHVADGLALLANAYASLDVDAVPSHPTGASPVDGGATRTRRVAEQLALRCSCTALASLAIAGVGGVPPWSAGEGAAGVNDPVSTAAATAATSMPPLSSSSLANAGVRLREWWASQVLHDLCGNGIAASGAHVGWHRGAAVQQLRRVLGWLPGTAEYCFP